MDVLDLNERGMETSIAQELEISMLCSSLVSLNICPNLVLVSSVFQSEFGAPNNLWRNPQRNGLVLRENKELSNERTIISAVDLPKKSQLQRGNFQYIKMEFCPGGDLEDLVRRAVRLQVQVVRSILFQMFFAFYTCREKFNLRHFDVKLLNFFVSTGGSLLSPIQKLQHEENEKSLNYEKNNNNNNYDNFNNRYHDNVNISQDNQIVKMRIGFGDHIFSIPLSINSLCVVKLADFGTSAVGAAGLGESITQQQVSNNVNLLFLIIYYYFFLFISTPQNRENRQMQ